MHHRGGLGLWLWCLAPLSCFITGFVTRLTRQVPLVEQKLPTLPENLRSPPVFLWRSCYSILSFMCMFCRSLFVILYFFFCSLRCLFFFDIWILITHIFSIYGFWLPVFFRYMDSDYPYFFDIWILITRIFSMDSDYPFDISSNSSTIFQLYRGGRLIW